MHSLGWHALEQVRRFLTLALYHAESRRGNGYNSNTRPSCDARSISPVLKASRTASNFLASSTLMVGAQPVSSSMNSTVTSAA